MGLGASKVREHGKNTDPEAPPILSSLDFPDVDNETLPLSRSPRRDDEADTVDWIVTATPLGWPRIAGDARLQRVFNASNSNGRWDDTSASSPSGSTSWPLGAIWSGPVAPTIVSDGHLRVLRLHILIFEIGGPTLEREMRRRAEEHGGWKEWLEANRGDVYRYQFINKMGGRVLPNPDPSSWDITFLTYLSRCRGMTLSGKKKGAADKLREFRNMLSHELKTSIEESEFEGHWKKISNSILSLVDGADHNRLKNEIGNLKRLQLPHLGFRSSATCGCNDPSCGQRDQLVEALERNSDNTNNQNGESIFRIPCWNCGGARRVFANVAPSSANFASNELILV